MKKQNSKHITSNRKVEIYPFDQDPEKRSESWQLIRDYSYHSRHMANEIINIKSAQFTLKNIKKQESLPGIKTITELLQEETQRNILSGKKEKQFKANGEEKTYGNTEKNLAYKITSEKYSELLPSGIRSALANKVTRDFDNAVKDVMSGKKTFPSYKQGIPVFVNVNKKLFAFKPEDKNYIFNLIGINFKTNLGRDRSNNKAIIENIITGKYNICDVSIQINKDNKKMFLNLTFKHEPIISTQTLNSDKVLGVDVGFNTPAYASIPGTNVKMAIGQKEDFLKQRTRIYQYRRALSAALTQTNGGHGRAHKLRKLENVRNKESNFMQTYNHMISNKVVKLAFENGCGTINLEDLSGITRNEHNQFLMRNWSYYQLREFIVYKAKKHGIEVNIIDPMYSSQRCSECGYIHKENRPTQQKFECLSCGFKENADFNASRNIAIAHTEEYKKQILNFKKQKEKEKVAS